MKGQHFIVTGGTSGLGLSIVRKLLENKVHVTLLVRDVDKATRIFEQELGKTINVIPCDLNDLKSIQALQFEDNTSFDGFIYSAGLGYFKSISDHSFSEMIETYQLNLISFNVLYTVLRPYLTSNAHIVGISRSKCCTLWGIESRVLCINECFKTRVTKLTYHDS
ncbi:hypothetical protein W757_01432 [Staphylococcus aureus VET0679S]|nr:hypothetical protein W757_01432 [Staphylococcus aureus VET0679S]